jgi:ABC-type nitrate/sulfonate/bicarbonate transport system permease component
MLNVFAGHSSTTTLWRIFLSAAVPYIPGGMRISLGIGLVVVIIAEVVSETGGPGDVIVHGQPMFLIVDSYASLAIIAALELALSAAFRRAERRATFWVAPVGE